ncbi:SMI1/KNR4 family protein [Flavobacterium sp.]|uniref:SMI1/KNR4 family protein n=1 Tax=Flavobacterium sp. TaxID=239 RepID=UPI001223364B|nr:SMI1/KNR4 family protein [Flavobacterium sp.]RZJ73848.1 MAG: SMI1/KNR4 family protein [Flavobacterium sp.]
MAQKIFHDFDFSDFWDDDEYSKSEFQDETPSDELIASIETELGYKLPESYIELMKSHNGGITNPDCFPTDEHTSWAEDHVAINGIMGIGREKTYSLCGNLGSQFMIDEWGYPDTGVYICDCPSAGHDMVMLDYSNCGKGGEPEVFHVDQESDYKKTFLAKDFETFIRGLVRSDVYDTSEQDLADKLKQLENGLFSDTLQEYFKKDTSVDFDKILRNLFLELSREKGYFALHADELSYLAYDIQFYLLSLNKTIRSKELFVKEYLPMVALATAEISTGGYADFFSEWFDQRRNSRKIAKKLFGGFYFTNDFKRELFGKMKRYE